MKTEANYNQQWQYIDFWKEARAGLCDQSKNTVSIFLLRLCQGFEVAHNEIFVPQLLGVNVLKTETSLVFRGTYGADKRRAEFFLFDDEGAWRLPLELLRRADAEYQKTRTFIYQPQKHHSDFFPLWERKRAH